MKDPYQFFLNNSGPGCGGNELIGATAGDMDVVIQESPLQNALDTPKSLKSDQIIMPILHKFLRPLKVSL